jgi:membrane protease YdiL (CAAX protease family)
MGLIKKVLHSETVSICTAGCLVIIPSVFAFFIIFHWGEIPITDYLIGGFGLIVFIVVPVLFIDIYYKIKKFKQFEKRKLGYLRYKIKQLFSIYTNEQDKVVNKINQDYQTYLKNNNGRG